MITKEFSHHFAQHWIDAWNSHKMDQILSHYTDDFEMSSPYIVTLMNEASGTLKGKEKISDYWTIALTRFPDLEFRLREVFHSTDSIILYYHSVHRGTDSAEYFLFNEDGKVVKSAGHYQ